jgi:hypothetical protein
MKRNKHMKIATNTTCPAFALFALACFALSPAAQAVAPAPDGGYPGQNTAEGDDALFSLTTGVSNTAIGFDALFSNAGGFGNTGVGSSALGGNTGGIDNTAVGAAALINNTNGFGNVAVGFSALLLSTTTVGNTAVGFGALGLNTIGDANVAIGFDVLGSNTTGYGNTATGYDALITNGTGGNNTANGAFVLSSNISGDDNTANGFDALAGNTTGNNNTATGSGALGSNTEGAENTANGINALASNTTGSNNIALGSNAGANLTTGNFNIHIGNAGVAGESNKICIGTEGTHTATYIAGIGGAPLVHGAAVAVGITADGQLGVRASSARFKEAIKPMDKASEAILALKPVTFRYKHELDPDGIPQFGLVAEQVEKVNPDLVARDAQGKVFTVRYDEVNAMLLNEFLKEHRKVQQLEANDAEQQSEIKPAAGRNVSAADVTKEIFERSVEKHYCRSQYVVFDQRVEAIVLGKIDQIFNAPEIRDDTTNVFVDKALVFEHLLHRCRWLDFGHQSQRRKPKFQSQAHFGWVLSSEYDCVGKTAFVLVSTQQCQRDMNKRNEARFTRSIGVLCRWIGARSIVATS